MKCQILKYPSKFSADSILKYFACFSQETEFDILCTLFPIMTVCIKCQVLFSWKNKKNISYCRLLKNLLRVLSIIQENIVSISDLLELPR